MFLSAFDIDLLLNPDSIINYLVAINHAVSSNLVYVSYTIIQSRLPGSCDEEIGGKLELLMKNLYKCEFKSRANRLDHYG